MNVEEFELLNATLYLTQLSVAQNHKVPSGYLIGKDVEGSNRYSWPKLGLNSPRTELRVVNPFLYYEVDTGVLRT